MENVSLWVKKLFPRIFKKLLIQMDKKVINKEYLIHLNTLNSCKKKENM